MKNMIGIFVCMLLITLVLPTSIAEVESLKTSEDEVEIDICAGWRHKDIGIGFAVYLLNHKTENVTVFFNVTLDYIFRNDYVSDEWNETLPPEYPYSIHHSCSVCTIEPMKIASITVEVEDTIVTRKGFAIGSLLILFK